MVETTGVSRPIGAVFLSLLMDYRCKASRAEPRMSGFCSPDPYKRLRIP